MWNSAPGALAVLPKYADHLAAFPFFTLNMGTKPSAKFTAIILAKSPIVSSSASIMKLIKNVAHSTYVAQVSLFKEFELDGLVFFHPIPLLSMLKFSANVIYFVYPSSPFEDDNTNVIYHNTIDIVENQNLFCLSSLI